MKQWIAAAALAASLGLAAAAPAQATAALTVDGSGSLTGATGVTIGSATYDVDFRDGSCFGLFGGCVTSAFAFHSSADAEAAAEALLAQVFINDGTHSFDTLPGKTEGCAGTAAFCDVLIPYDLLLGFSEVATVVAINDAAEANDGTLAGFTPGTNADTANLNFLTWAVFTPVSSVPEASTWAMMLLGFGGIGAALRRRKVAAPA